MNFGLPELLITLVILAIPIAIIAGIIVLVLTASRNRRPPS